MHDLSALTHPSGNWSIKVPLLLLYTAAIALFFVIHWTNLKVFEPLSRKPAGAGPLALVLALAAATGFAGVGALVALAKQMALTPPLAIVALPLFLLLESHVRKLLADKEKSALHLCAAAGAIAGVASSAWIWMRHSPLV